MELSALVVADSIFHLKSRKSGRSVVGEVRSLFQQHCQLHVQFNENRHGAQFRTRMLDDLRNTLHDGHRFVWIISMVNDLFNNKFQVVWDRDGIMKAGQAYQQLLEGIPHVIVFGGRGNLWGIDDPLYEKASKESVRDLSQLSLNVLWGGDLMGDWSANDFANWHWAGSSRGRAVDFMITLMMEAAQASNTPPPAPAISPPLPAAPPHKMHPSKTNTFHWQQRTKVLECADVTPRIWPLTPKGGSVIIMSGLHEFALPQVMHCKSSFESLGFSVIVCQGLVESSTCEQPPAGSGYRTSVAWGAICVPKLVSLLERQEVATSDLFVLVEDSCQPTEECAPDRLAQRFQPEQNVWCGAVREYKQRTISNFTSFISNGDSPQEVVLTQADSKVFAPAGSKMFVCGIEFLRKWKDMFWASPTAWTVDDHNQVLVASGHLQVQLPFLAGQYYPHYSQRTHQWSDGSKDDKKVQLLAPLREVPVVVTAMEPYEAEGRPYMHVHVGDQIQLSKEIFVSGEQSHLYSTYAHGHKLKQRESEPVEVGWFPIHIFHNAQTQLRIAGAQFV